MKAATREAKSDPGKTSRISTEKTKTNGFGNLVLLSSISFQAAREFAEVEAGALRQTQAEYDVRFTVTAVREVLTPEEE